MDTPPTASGEENIDVSPLEDPGPGPTFDFESLWANEPSFYHVYTDTFGELEEEFGPSLDPNYLQLHPESTTGTSSTIDGNGMFRSVILLIHFLPFRSLFLIHPSPLLLLHLPTSQLRPHPPYSTSSLHLNRTHHSPNPTENTITTAPQVPVETRKARRLIEQKSRDKRNNTMEKLKKVVEELTGESYTGKRNQIALLKDTAELLM
jgi:hypothetical protein